MIRILMLDLGDTLANDHGVFPHVPDALKAISGFETGADERLPMCLISDYRMPATPGEIDVLFGEYLNQMEQLGLNRSSSQWRAALLSRPMLVCVNQLDGSLRRRSSVLAWLPTSQSACSSPRMHSTLPFVRAMPCRPCNSAL